MAHATCYSKWVPGSTSTARVFGASTEIGFNEADTVYTKEDIRFTVKGDTIYATFLAWPGKRAIIKTLRAQGLKADKFEEDTEAAGDAPSLAGKTPKQRVMHLLWRVRHI